MVVRPDRLMTGTVASRREDQEAMFLVLVVLDPVAGPRGEAMVTVEVVIRLLRAVMMVTKMKKKMIVRFDLNLGRIPARM